MGAVESSSGRRGSAGNDSDDGEDWMQADKYAEWTCADNMDYNGTAITVEHVEMPLNAEEKARVLSLSSGGMNTTTATTDGTGTTGRGSPDFRFTHEALVFDVMCSNGRITKFTAELTFSGVLKRWGHHQIISRVKGHKNINLPMTEVFHKIQTPKRYDLLSYNCKHYAVDKFRAF